MNYFNVNNSLQDRLLIDSDEDESYEENKKINERTIKNIYNYYLQGFSNIFLEIFNFISSLVFNIYIISYFEMY